ncbi:hypothetical protein OFC87_39625, partial [Escherichia coli]|nr:hypothetical protein [Escherichia coli]
MTVCVTGGGSSTVCGAWVAGGGAAVLGVVGRGVTVMGGVVVDAGPGAESSPDITHSTAATSAASTS